MPKGSIYTVFQLNTVAAVCKGLNETSGDTWLWSIGNKQIHLHYRLILRMNTW